jgi:uncharacterized protein
VNRKIAMKKFLLMAVVGWLVGAVMPAVVHAGDAEIPKLTSYVTDQTGTIAPMEKELLVSRLRAFEDSTSNQIVVLMVPTIGDAALEDYSMKIVEANKIGQKGKSNGVLLLVAKNDHKVRIEVGYGLEGALTDAISSLIIRREMAPRFRQSDYFGGISAAVDAIMLATKNEYKAEEKDAGDDSYIAVIMFIIIVVILIIAIRNSSRGPRRYVGGIGSGMWGSSGGSSWGSSSSGSSFSDSSFSGGGGSFGGGGSSGSW